MKLSVVYFPNDLGHPAVQALLGERIATKEVTWGSALSEQYLATFSALSGCRIRLCFSFSDQQCESDSHFILRPKHLLVESNEVLAANTRYIEQQPVHHSDKFGHHRLRDSVFVANLKPQFDRIWSLETSGAYIAADELVADMLEQFTGLYEVPLRHYKSGQPLQGWRSFGSATWLPQLHLDDTVTTLALADGTHCLRPLGLLSATGANLQSLPDVARLPSATALGDSDYIVSQRLWQYWKNHGIKSFRPEPLLNADSAQYQQYRALIDAVRSRLAAYPANHFTIHGITNTAR